MYIKSRIVRLSISALIVYISCLVILFKCDYSETLFTKDTVEVAFLLCILAAPISLTIIYALNRLFTDKKDRLEKKEAIKCFYKIMRILFVIWLPLIIYKIFTAKFTMGI